MPYAYEHALEHGKFHRRFKGSFAPSGGGISSAAGAVRGTGFSVAYGGSTGLYRVTLEEGFTRLIEGQLTYQGASADTAPTVLQIGDVSPTNRTIDIVVWQEGAGTLAKANIAASGVLRRINFEFAVAVDDMPGSGATA